MSLFQPDTMAGTRHQPNGVVIAFGLALVVAIIVLAFAWPGVAADPRNVPVAIVGPDEQATQLVTMIEGNGNGAIELTQLSDREAAIEAIEKREYYGAIIIGQSPEVLIATAANPAVAQMLTGIVSQLQAQSEEAVPAVTTTDVVPFLEDDPRGSGMAAATLPLVLGGILGGVAISLSIRGKREQILSLLTYVVSAGAAITLVMQGLFGVLAGYWWLNALVFAGCLLAIAATIVGAVAVVGRGGVALGPVVFLLFANPIAGVSVPKEFLPSPWGEIGQWFPPGAGATLLRSVSYFPEASTLFPWLVLTGWIVAGFALMMIGSRKVS